MSIAIRERSHGHGVPMPFVMSSVPSETLTGERDDFAISSSHDDGVIGRLLVARRVLVATSCGEIESD